MKNVSDLTQAQVLNVLKALLNSDNPDVGLGMSICDIDPVVLGGSQQFVMLTAPFTYEGADYDFRIISVIDLDDTENSVFVKGIPFMYFTDEAGDELRYTGDKAGIEALVHKMADKGVFDVFLLDGVF